MDNILRDGTQIDQTVFKDLDLNQTASPTIMSEFSLPFKFLKNIENGDKCYYVKISLNYVNDTSSGKLNAYLIWR
jgi:hypothetical protein